MKTLVIPDIHLAIAKVDAVLAFETPYDRVIYLGDIFDEFGDTGQQARDAAIWYKAQLADPKTVACIGNHDASYRYSPQHRVYCSGWTQAKDTVVNSILAPDDWAKLKLYHIQDGILFTHAGLSNEYLNRYAPRFKNRTLAGLKGWLDRQDKRLHKWGPCCLEDPAEATGGPLPKGGRRPLGPWILGAGAARGGSQEVGGVAWCDMDEFAPIRGIRQVFGHTPLRVPGITYINTLNHECNVSLLSTVIKDLGPQLDTTWGLDLDTRGHRFYSTIEDGTLAVHEVEVHNGMFSKGKTIWTIKL